jgi:hypothetical protein
VSKRLADVETAGDDSVVTEMFAGHNPMFHANLCVRCAIHHGLFASTALLCRYTHLNVPQGPDVDSSHRMARAAQLPPPTVLQDIVNVLGDTTDPLSPPYCPIYRVRVCLSACLSVCCCVCGVLVQLEGCKCCVWYHDFFQAGPDLYTLATALFDLNNCTIRVVSGNPLTAPVEEAMWLVPGCQPTLLAWK